MDSLKGIFFVLITLGVGIGLFFHGNLMWQGVSGEIVAGENLLWASLGVFGVSLIWQIVGLVQLYRQPEKTKIRRWLTILVGGYSAFVIIYALVLNVMTHRGAETAKAWVTASGQGFKDLIMPDTGWFTICLYLGYIIVMAIITGVLLFCFLMLGRIGVGLSLGVALHNWANGAGFDLAGFIKSFFTQLLPELSLSDFWGMLFTIIWFLVSQHLLKSSDVSSVDSVV